MLRETAAADDNDDDALIYAIYNNYCFELERQCVASELKQ
jgi:hypothetical protein